LLWEFWRSELDLFPTNILKEKNLNDQPHSLVFVFDGSFDEVPNGEEECQFYRDIINRAKKRDYFMPQIVLTCLDKVELKILKKFKNLSESDLDCKLREVIDSKIESVVCKLGVARDQVHFLENYHSTSKFFLRIDNPVNLLQIDYNCLKLLQECIKQGD
jgi:hypothetical protein